MNENVMNKQESKIKKWWNENYEVALPYAMGLAIGVAVTAAVAAVYVRQNNKVMTMGFATCVLNPELLEKTQEIAREITTGGA